MSDLTTSEAVIRVLMLEDEAVDADVALFELLKAGMQIEFKRVETRQALMDALQTFSPDVVLADYQLPGFDGLSALALVRDATQSRSSSVGMMNG